MNVVAIYEHQTKWNEMTITIWDDEITFWWHQNDIKFKLNWWLNWVNLNKNSNKLSFPKRRFDFVN